MVLRKCWRSVALLRVPTCQLSGLHLDLRRSRFPSFRYERIVCRKKPLSRMKTIEARTLRDLEDVVATLAPKHQFCYRGHRDARWKLVPSAFRALVRTRPIDATDYAFLAQIERDTYREFDSESRPLLKSLPLLDQMAVAQHYGVPTRCMDWTTDIRVAAFFATDPQDDTDAAVWALDFTSFPFPKELGRQHRSGGFLLPKLNHYSGGHRPSFAQEVSRSIGASVASSPQPAPPPSQIPA